MITLNGSSVKTFKQKPIPLPTYRICIKVWWINGLKLGGNRTSLSTKFSQWSRLFKHPLSPSIRSLSLDYHHWPHFEIPFAKVSWVRHRDIHILTAGAYTYTSDQRFQALHRQNTGQNSEWSEWTLCIKWAQERDQGLYECQISTIPVKSHQFRLNVVSKSPPSFIHYNF